MERITREFSYDILDRTELTPQEIDDLSLATEAREHAHAPISGFKVGACLHMNNGDTVVGWNWENNVHTTLHAEKNAIGRLIPEARESGLGRVTVMGGYSYQESEKTLSPCGNCRQDLIELWRPETEPMVVMAGIRGLVKRIKFADLVPLLFDLERHKTG